MPLIIDPPVGQFSPVSEIQRWILELEQLQYRPGFTEDDRALIRWELAQARDALAFRTRFVREQTHEGE